MKVRCIDAGDSDGELKLGEVYTLDRIDGGSGTYFYLEGRDGGWNSRRFETLDAGFTPIPDAPAGDAQCDSHNFQPDGNGEWYCRKCRIPSAGTILAARAAGAGTERESQHVISGGADHHREVVGRATGVNVKGLRREAGQGRMTLAERVQQLEDYVAELKQTFGLNEDPRWVAMGLTVNQGKIMQALSKNDVLTKEALMFALYDGGADYYDRDHRIVDVQVCKINAKLRPHGIHVDTVWGRGRQIAPENKQRLEAML